MTGRDRPLLGRRWAVAGGGVLGLSTAWRLAQAGASVVLYDPAAPGDNASGIAAGMLAPAFEAALDPETGLDFADLAAARDLWPAFAQEAGIGLDRSGALLAGPDAERITPTLRSIGARHEALTAAQARARSPGLATGHMAVFTPEDWRVDAPSALAQLAAAARRAGVEIVQAEVSDWSCAGRRVRLTDGGELAVDGLVVATGAATALLEAERRLIAPIKGQLLRSAAGPVSGPTVRAAGVYVTPGAGGAVVGATMQPGLNDRTVEAAAMARLLSMASMLFPDLAGAPCRGAAAVRAATPDGLPLVGFGAGGALLAVGARRNGWLLAPWVATLAVRLAAGETSLFNPFDPSRFAAGAGVAKAD